VARALLAQNNPVLIENRKRALDAQKRALAGAHARELEAHARELEAHAERERQRLRKATVELCDVLAIEITAERRALVDAMASDELDRLRSAIIAQRRWPEAF
jgi:hypothetical protein